MKLQTWARQWLRRDWPDRNAPRPQSAKVAIVVVNYNTGKLLSQLLFSIFRVLDRRQIGRVVLVDNASTDDSGPILRSLRDAGLVDVLFNPVQRYHGPALNQAMDHLATEHKRAPPAAPPFGYVWILDSDTVVIRPEAIEHPVEALMKSGAGIAGESQPCRGLPEGYAHISSLLLDPRKVWRRGIVPFENRGAPARAFQRSLRSRGVPICDFPYRSSDYVLHLGRGTLRQIKESGDNANRYYGWGSNHCESHYHGNPRGPAMHQNFLRVFNAEVPDLTPEALTSACQREERVSASVFFQDVGNQCCVVPHD
jgi:glycosyltransferase involved in cell wall biosynthesis